MADFYYVPIPSRDKATEEQWLAFCEEHDLDYLGNHPTSKRAWSDKLKTYVRSSCFLVYHEGVLIDMVEELP